MVLKYLSEFRHGSATIVLACAANAWFLTRAGFFSVTLSWLALLNMQIQCAASTTFRVLYPDPFHAIPFLYKKDRCTMSGLVWLED